MDNIAIAIKEGRTSLGIELGSTRIKAVLIDENHNVLASGAYDWENSYENGVWTYSMDKTWEGLRACYGELADNVREKYGVELTTTGAACISAMMHGYLPFDEKGEQLAGFRTWRNTITGEAAAKLTELFNFNIPQRWSIAHLYQAVLNGEEHVKELASLTTLAGYVHSKLTGCKVVGVGEASGMFPIDSSTCDYNEEMVKKFDALAAEKGYEWKLRDILPKVLVAGQNAGTLTAEGAALLDPGGVLQAGIPFAPPEGDAGTGMAATNSVGLRTGNVSAGTSIFSMVVLERPLEKVYEEIDMVTTPDGSAVAMVHCNNCTSDIDAWANLFCQFASLAGFEVPYKKSLDMLYAVALEGDGDCGGLLSYNYYSGEPVAGLDEGFPLFVRDPGSKLGLANFMRAHLQTALATLKIGMDILKGENVKIQRMYGHGGYFKAPGVGQRLLAGAIDAPVYVMHTAAEGGPWGAALLAAYMIRAKEGQSLEAYLAENVFAGLEGEGLEAKPEDVKGFEEYMARFTAGLNMQKAAIESLSKR